MKASQGEEKDRGKIETHTMASASDSGPEPIMLHRRVIPGTASRPSYALELHSCLQARKNILAGKDWKELRRPEDANGLGIWDVQG